MPKIRKLHSESIIMDESNIFRLSNLNAVISGIRHKKRLTRRIYTLKVRMKSKRSEIVKRIENKSILSKSELLPPS